MERTRQMKFYPSGMKPREDRMTRHHVTAQARGGRWETGNIFGLREQRHSFYNKLFGERSFAEAAAIIDALVSALAYEDELFVTLLRCKRRWERVKFERGYRGAVQCLVFWHDKSEMYQRFFRRARPDPRDAEALRRANRMLKARALREKLIEEARRRDRGAREEEFAAAAFAQ